MFTAECDLNFIQLTGKTDHANQYWEWGIEISERNH